MDSNRVFVIGLDGATFNLLDPWIEGEKLPHLKKLIRESCYGHLESTIPPISPPAWTSFMTGVNPGKHGIYDFVTFKPNSFERILVNSSHIRSKRLWDLIGEYNKKSIVLYVPLTYPPDKIEGVMISGIPTPPQGDFIYPKELKRELDDQLGNWWMEMEGDKFRNFQEETFLNDIYKVIETRFKVARYLMNKAWDLFIVVFMETDLVQHFLWGERERYILPLYTEIDKMIGLLMEGLRDRDTIIILSDHGFGPIRKTLYLNAWLKKKKYLEDKKQWVGSKEDSEVEVFHRKEGPPLLRRIKWKLIKKRSVIDWSGTKAYFINTGQFHGVRINLMGREQEGMVRKEEYEYLRNQIIKELKALIDKEENKRVITNVFRREEIYSGPYVNQAPDIIFIPDYEYILSDRIRNHIFKKRKDSRGVHRREGIFIMHGPNIKRGEKMEGAHIMDIAPTILYLLGTPIPKDFDGKVLTEAIDPHRVQQNPIVFKDIALNIEGQKIMMNLNEEEEIKKRLQGLGYIE